MRFKDRKKKIKVVREERNKPKVMKRTKEIKDRAGKSPKGQAVGKVQ
jgi:hypothetical protein